MEYRIKTFWFVQQYLDSLVNQPYPGWDKEKEKIYNKNIVKARQKAEKLSPILTDFIKFVYDNEGELPNPPSSNRSPFIFIQWDREKYADDIKYPFPKKRKEAK